MKRIHKIKGEENIENILQIECLQLCFIIRNLSNQGNFILS